MTLVVTGGRIFERPRAWLDRRSRVAGEWIRCAMCFGFFAGVVGVLVGLWPRTGCGPAVDLAAGGAASSGFCWTMRVVLHRLGEDEP